LAKLVVLATTVLSVPLTFQYLGADRYGLWMTITSLVLFLGFADFGLGNGLASALAEADGKEDRVFARQQVSCAFYLLLGIAALLLCTLAAAYRFIPWQDIYRTRTALATAEAGPATAVLVICAALNMPLGTVLRVQIGYQQGYIGDLWNALGNLIALLCVFAAVKLHFGLPMLVAGLAGSPLIATAVNWVIQFKFRTPWLQPSLTLIEWRSMFHLARTGLLFFVQQCCGLIYYVSDNLVIAQTLDSPHVARFAVMQRVFSLGLISQYFMTPLWPAFGEALIRRDFDWARSTIKRAITGNFVVGGAAGVLLLFMSGPLVKRWTGSDAGPIDGLRFGFCLWVILVGYIAAMNAFLNQRGVMAKHLIYFGSASLLSLALKIVLVHYWALSGIVWATLIGFGLVYIVPAARLAFGNLKLRDRQADVSEWAPSA
jgi:O-antigen/teichoic acid export membrane protein